MDMMTMAHRDDHTGFLDRMYMMDVILYHAETRSFFREGVRDVADDDGS